MPQFQYDKYTSPYAASIASLMLRPAAAQADAIMAGADAQARAAQQSGQAWAGAAQGIGQAVAAIPQQIQQAKAFEQQQQFRQAQIADMQAQQKQRDAAAAIAQRDVQAQQVWSRAIRASIGEDGKPDYDKAAQLTEAAGFGVQANTYLEANQKTRATALALQTAQKQIEDGKRAFAKASANQAGEYAAIGLSKLEANPLEARDHFTALIAHAATDGLIDEKRAHELLTQTAQAGPDQLRALYQGVLDQSPDVKDRLAKANLESRFKESEIAKNNAAALKEPVQKSLQSENEWQVDGKSTPVIFDPATGARYLSQADVAAKNAIDPSRLRKIPPASTKVTVAGTGLGGGAMTDEAVEDLAARFRILGPSGLPTRIEESDKRRILNEQAAQSKRLGMTPVQSIQKMAANKADATSLTLMRKLQSSATSFEYKALQQADIIEELSQKVDRSQIPLLNRAILSGKKELLGDADTQLLYNAITTFQSEYAKIMEGSTGSVAASSVSARQAASDLIKGTLNKETMTKTLALLKREMRLSLKGYDVALEQITTRMGGAPLAPTEPVTAPPPPAPKTVSIAQVQAVAAKNGTTYLQEKARAEAEGFIVR